MVAWAGAPATSARTIPASARPAALDMPSSSATVRGRRTCSGTSYAGALEKTSETPRKSPGSARSSLHGWRKLRHELRVRHKAIGLLDEPRDLGPVGAVVQHDADPSAASDVRRTEVPLGV